MTRDLFGYFADALGPAGVAHELFEEASKLVFKDTDDASVRAACILLVIAQKRFEKSLAEVDSIATDMQSEALGLSADLERRVEHSTELLRMLVAYTSYLERMLSGKEVDQRELGGKREEDFAADIKKGCECLWRCLEGSTGVKMVA